LLTNFRAIVGKG